MRLLVLMAVIYFGYRALKSWANRQVAGRTGKSVRRGRAGEITDVMVQDPQCGIYLPQREGIPLTHAGRTLYFCSAECRDTYIAAQRQGTSQ